MARSTQQNIVVLKRSDSEDRETTVYVKGFLARNEKAEDFRSWEQSHLELVERLDWGPRCAGYRWPAGKIFAVGKLPVPVAVFTSTAFRLYRQQRRRLKLAVPTLAAQAIVEEVVLLAGRLAYQYLSATKGAVDRSTAFAEKLRDLRRRYEYVRIVGHSLGCRHAIEAISSLDPDDRPDEVHLCAPALREADYEELLHGLARRRTVIYYTERDLILSTVFRVLSLGHALGARGPTQCYTRLRSVDISKHVGLRAHSQYSEKFGVFASGS